MSDVATLRKGLHLLGIVGESAEPMTLSRLCREARLSLATAHRYLATLQDLNYVRRDAASGTYRLGSRALRLGATALSQLELRSVASSALNDLMRVTNETIHLSLLDGMDVVYIDKVDSMQAVRMWSAVGSRLPAHCSAAGKALLAYLPDRELTDRMSLPLERLTPKTITTWPGLVRELQAVRRQGYAVDDRENRVDIRCVAAPVFDHAGDVAGAVSLSAPVTRMSTGKMPSMGRLVAETARRISSDLGAFDGATVGVATQA